MEHERSVQSCSAWDHFEDPGVRFALSSVSFWRDALDRETAKHYLELVRKWLPKDQAHGIARIAISDAPVAHETAAAFWLRPEPPILVRVVMAYEGPDVPEAAMVAALTHIRS